MESNSNSLKPSHDKGGTDSAYAAISSGVPTDRYNIRLDQRVGELKEKEKERKLHHKRRNQCQSLHGFLSQTWITSTSGSVFLKNKTFRHRFWNQELHVRNKLPAVGCDCEQIIRPWGGLSYEGNENHTNTSLLHNKQGEKIIDSFSQSSSPTPETKSTTYSEPTNKLNIRSNQTKSHYTFQSMFRSACRRHQRGNQIKDLALKCPLVLYRI